MSTHKSINSCTRKLPNKKSFFCKLILKTQGSIGTDNGHFICWRTPLHFSCQKYSKFIEYQSWNFSMEIIVLYLIYHRKTTKYIVTLVLDQIYFALLHKLYPNKKWQIDDTTIKNIRRVSKEIKCQSNKSCLCVRRMEFCHFLIEYIKR